MPCLPALAQPLAAQARFFSVARRNGHRLDEGPFHIGHSGAIRTARLPGGPASPYAIDLVDSRLRTWTYRSGTRSRPGGPGSAVAERRCTGTTLRLEAKPYRTFPYRRESVPRLSHAERGRLGALSANSKRTAEQRHELASRAHLAASVAAVVNRAPELTPDQLARLRVLFAPTVSGAKRS